MISEDQVWSQEELWKQIIAEISKDKTNSLIATSNN